MSSNIFTLEQNSPQSWRPVFLHCEINDWHDPCCWRSRRPADTGIWTLSSSRTRSCRNSSRLLWSWSWEPHTVPPLSTRCVNNKWKVTLFQHTTELNFGVFFLFWQILALGKYSCCERICHIRHVSYRNINICSLTEHFFLLCPEQKQ